MSGFNIKTEKILSMSNIKRIIMLGISLKDSISALENKCIEDYDATKTYVKNSLVIYNGYIYKTKTVTTGDFDENKFEKIGDDLDLLTLDDIKALINLSDEEIASLQSLISTEIRLDRCFSSSDAYNRILNAENECKKFTLEQLAKKAGVVYKVVADTTGVDSTEFLYLISNGSNGYNIYAYIDGSAVKISDTNINLDNYAKLSDLNNYYDKATSDGKYATITTVDGKVDKTSILSTLSSTPSDDKLLSEKAIKSELDKKIDKSNIVTTIDNTVTDEQIASARAVLNSKSAKRMNESINPENYEVGDWYAEGYDGILLSTSDGHPCSEWHIGYVVTGFKTSDGKGYKKIFAITMNGNCYVKVQKWDKWTEWQKLCTTSVYDELDKKVDKTSIVTSVDSASTDAQVPSAKSVYNLAGNENRRGYVYNNPTYRGNKWNRVFRVNSLLSCDSGFLTVTVYSNGLCQIATFLMSKNFNRLNIKQINCGGYNGDKGQSRPIKVRIVSAETSGYSFLEIYVSGTSNTNVVTTYMPLSCNSVVVLNEEGSIPNGMFACEMTATHDTYDSATYTSVLK